MRPRQFRCLVYCVGLAFVSRFSSADDLAQAKHFAKIESLFRPPKELINDYGAYRSPLLFDDGKEVRTSEEWQGRRQEILRKWTQLMGPWPALLEKPTIEIIDQQKRENFHQKRVRVELAQGLFEEGYLLVPIGPGPFPAVLVPYYEPHTSIGKDAPFRDFGYQLAKRGFVSLSIGSPGGSARDPQMAGARCQPLSFLAYMAANGFRILASLPEVDPKRVGIVGHSYGGKWAMFAACLCEQFACAAFSDPGVVFDETRPNVNYWEPWYLGYDSTQTRKPGLPTPENGRTGAYRKMMDEGRDLHELHALMAPRPFLVSGGSEDPPQRWRALNHSVAINHLLGHEKRVAMSNRLDHTPNEESNEQIYLFFQYFLNQDR